jgi:hypothetical protein
VSGPPGVELAQRALAGMWNGCVDHDPTGQILTSWPGSLRRNYARSVPSPPASATRPIRRRLWRFYAWCADPQIPDLTTLAETIETWWPAVVVFLQTGLTNAPAPRAPTDSSNRSREPPVASEIGTPTAAEAVALHPRRHAGCRRGTGSPGKDQGTGYQGETELAASCHISM